MMFTEVTDHPVVEPAEFQVRPIADKPQVAIQLPTEYTEALSLVRSMHAACMAGDQAAMTDLRRQIPVLARSLAARWQDLLIADPRAAHRLESARLAVIREILAVDAQLRRLESPRFASVGDLIAGRRPRQPNQSGKA